MPKPEVQLNPFDQQPSAYDELLGRIETLGKKIQQRQAEAASHRQNAEEGDRAIAELLRLKGQYEQVLERAFPFTQGMANR